MLSAIDSENNIALNSALSQIDTPGIDPFITEIVLRHPTQQPRFIKIARDPGFSAGQPALAIVIVKAEVDFDLKPHLREAFSWSPAEAEIALSLAHGRNVNEIARSRSTSVATVRTQIKTMIGKTSTASMVDLIATIIRLIATHP